MKLLEVIPVTVAPKWLIAIFILSAISLIIAFMAHDSDWAPILALVGVIILIVSVGLIKGKVGYVYDHDEYIVELNDMSATEFYSKYELIHTYEYSDAVRVRKKDGVK